MRTQLSWLALPGAVLVLSQALVSQSAPDPWKTAELLEPSALAQTLQSSQVKPPVIIAVAFPVLYNNKHLPHAIFAGPGSQPQGIDELKSAVDDNWFRMSVNVSRSRSNRPIRHLDKPGAAAAHLNSHVAQSRAMEFNAWPLLVVRTAHICQLA